MFFTTEHNSDSTNLPNDQPNVLTQLLDLYVKYVAYNPDTALEPSDWLDLYASFAVTSTEEAALFYMREMVNPTPYTPNPLFAELAAQANACPLSDSQLEKTAPYALKLLFAQRPVVAAHHGYDLTNRFERGEVDNILCDEYPLGTGMIIGWDKGFDCGEPVFSQVALYEN